MLINATDVLEKGRGVLYKFSPSSCLNDFGANLDCKSIKLCLLGDVFHLLLSLVLEVCGAEHLRVRWKTPVLQILPDHQHCAVTYIQDLVIG